MPLERFSIFLMGTPAPNQLRLAVASASVGVGSSKVTGHTLRARRRRALQQRTSNGEDEEAKAFARSLGARTIFVKLRLKPDQTARLVAALKRAGPREIGGQLFGEQLAPSDFLVTNHCDPEATRQCRPFPCRPGSSCPGGCPVLRPDAASLLEVQLHRRVAQSSRASKSSQAEPTSPRCWTLVCDPDFRGTFAVLMIVRVAGDSLCAAAWVFDPDRK